ncbi:MAG: 2-phospho-L-lactate transferase/gluconeogenesis factor (CofD/UPF0052 family) [Psychroserpens sp.]|jgi:2-phospho-L-lactate transferase/gluconeogenesis factor (CofD/UPF0052 family)
MKNVVVFCGGRGAEGLVRSMQGKCNLSLIVNAYDDGHSTGRLRELFNILGPSDCRKNVEYLLSKDVDENIKRYFGVRYAECNTISEVVNALELTIYDLNSLIVNEISAVILEWFISSVRKISDKLKALSGELALRDCSLMNLVLVNEVIEQGSFQGGVDTFLSGFNVTDNIILNSEENLTLMALTRSGHILFSEGDIVEGRSSEIIDEVYLIPHSEYSHVKEKTCSMQNYHEQVKLLRKYNVKPSLSPKALNAINNSDVIIYAAGTANSSLYPTYITQGLSAAISASSADKIMLTNIGADYETPDYKASDFLKNTLNFLGSETNLSATHSYRLIDTVFVNHPFGLDRHHIVFDNMEPVFSLVNVITGDFEDPKCKGRHSDNFFEIVNKLIFN